MPTEEVVNNDHQENKVVVPKRGLMQLRLKK
jgi:hypothetical protein